MTHHGHYLADLNESNALALKAKRDKRKKAAAKAAREG